MGNGPLKLVTARRRDGGIFPAEKIMIWFNTFQMVFAAHTLPEDSTHVRYFHTK